MPSTKIRFSQELWDFIENYKKDTGISIQHFMIAAAEKYKTDIEVQRALKDLPFQKPLSQEEVDNIFKQKQ